MTSRTPPRPRCFSAVRKPRQKTSSSLSPTSRPRTSRPPSAVIPVATTTAIDDHLGRRPLRDVQVGRVEVDVGELGVVQRPGPERFDDLVQARADPGDLGLGDPGADARARRPGRPRCGSRPRGRRPPSPPRKRLVDPAARLEDRREERPLAQLRDPQLDVTGLGGQQPRPGPLRSVVRVSVRS